MRKMPIDLLADIRKAYESEANAKAYYIKTQLSPDYDRYLELKQNRMYLEQYMLDRIQLKKTPKGVTVPF